MLSAVIMTKIATVLEEVVHVYAEQRTSRPKSDPGDRHPQHRDSEAFCDLFVGDYPINSESEWESPYRHPFEAHARFAGTNERGC